MGLPGKEETFDAAAVNASLVGTRFAHKVQHFATIGSTNVTMLEEAAKGAPEGTVYVADEQTAGRGRGGHTWHSIPGDGLYVSALVKPEVPLSEALWISLATGLAAQTAVREVSGVHLDLRWPNDLLVADKKCGGILVESAVDTETHSRLRYAVVGVGININHAEFPAELAALATSLRLQSERPQSRSAVLVALLRALDLELSKLEAGGAAVELLPRFTDASTWVRGKRVNVPEQGGYTGTTAGLNEHGFLLVDSDDGVQRMVLSGGVREL